MNFRSNRPRPFLNKHYRACVWLSGLRVRNESALFRQGELMFLWKSVSRIADPCLTAGDLSCARKPDATVVLPGDEPMRLKRKKVTLRSTYLTSSGLSETQRRGHTHRQVGTALNPRLTRRLNVLHVALVILVDECVLGLGRQCPAWCPRGVPVASLWRPAASPRLLPAHAR